MLSEQCLHLRGMRAAGLLSQSQNYFLELAQIYWTLLERASLKTRLAGSWAGSGKTWATAGEAVEPSLC